MNEETPHSNTCLTNYKEGSIRELWYISLPLMISTLASLFMIFVDRMFLARYSLDSLNASISAGTWAWAFFGGTGMITAMSEVFVSQNNGAKKYDQIGMYVWQMIWACMLSFIFFIPMALWGGQLLYHDTPYESLQIEYFRLLMIMGPSYALLTALSGFYIGRGKTRMLIVLAITANVLNIILDRILIFGIPGWVPELGIRGAGIATCFGYAFQAVILLFLFLQKKYRIPYGTIRWKFHFRSFTKCLRVGSPQGIFYTFEIAGFALFYQLMTNQSEMSISISGICQSLIILLSFFFDGLYRGVTAVSGNFIGAKKHEMIRSVIRSGVILQLIFSFMISLFFLVNVQTSIFYLFPGEFVSSAEMWNSMGYPIYKTLQFCLFCSFLFITFEGVRWTFAGILSSAGDTVFLLIAGSLSVWFFLILPIYLLLWNQALTIERAWIVVFLYSFLSCFVYWIRYKLGKWKNIQLI